MRPPPLLPMGGCLVKPRSWGDRSITVAALIAAIRQFHIINLDETRFPMGFLQAAIAETVPSPLFRKKAHTKKEKAAEFEKPKL